MSDRSAWWRPTITLLGVLALSTAVAIGFDAARGAGWITDGMLEAVGPLALFAVMVAAAYGFMVAGGRRRPFGPRWWAYCFVAAVLMVTVSGSIQSGVLQ